MSPAHRAIVLTSAQCRFLASQRQSCSRSYGTYIYTKQVFDLSKRHAQRAIILTHTQAGFWSLKDSHAHRAIVLAYTQSRFLVSQRQSCSQSYSTHTQSRFLVSQRQSCSQSYSTHTQSRFLVSQRQSCSQSYSTHIYTKQVFDLPKTVMLTEL